MIESPPSVSVPLNIGIVCSGKEYQFAAGLAAATYRVQLGATGTVTIYSPAGEKTSEQLVHLSEKYAFQNRAFAFTEVSERKYTSQLKCQGFHEAVQNVADGELLLLVDADTYCRKPIRISAALCRQLLTGKLGMVRDVIERHEKQQKGWWYVEPERRLPYVNSGVIATSRRAARLFARFREMAMDPLFLSGPFNDQTIINVALAKEFPQALVLLDRCFNGMRTFLNDETVIGHCAGGAGKLAHSKRQRSHLECCAELLCEYEARTVRNRGEQLIGTPLADWLTRGTFEYHRVGIGSRRMTFLQNGMVGLGAGGAEVFWHLTEEGGALVLQISSRKGLIPNTVENRHLPKSENRRKSRNAPIRIVQSSTEFGITCALRKDVANVWRGQWAIFEKGPVELADLSI